MKRRFAAILAAAALALGLSHAQHARADALGDTCELLKFMALGDMQGARDYWDELITHWSQTDRERGTANIFAPLQNLDLDDLKMYRIMAMPQVAEEYLAVSFLDGRPLYFRVFFENWGGEMRLVNFRYQQDFEKISAPPFVQQPEAISCP